MRKVEGTVTSDNLSPRKNLVVFWQVKHFFLNIGTGIIYHGGQSSTSSDLSPPMSDQQKSLPRGRSGRSRYHLHHINTNTTPRHHTKQKTLNSPPLTSPRNKSSNQIVVANQYEYSMPLPSSQFRPIGSRTINLTKSIPKLS